MRRLIIAPTLAAVLAGSLTTALAAPGNGTGQSSFPMTCDGVTVTFTIASGNWSAAYVSETGEHFLPKGTYFAVTDLATGELLYEELDAKPSADKADVTCTDAFEDGGVLITFEVYGKLR
jgi:hypothetical protein